MLTITDLVNFVNACWTYMQIVYMNCSSGPAVPRYLGGDG